MYEHLVNEPTLFCFMFLNEHSPERARRARQIQIENTTPLARLLQALQELHEFQERRHLNPNPQQGHIKHSHYHTLVTVTSDY